jgi:hypothetical protein
MQVWTRGSPRLCVDARAACRLPQGHPEGFIEALANLHGSVFDDIAARAGHGTATASPPGYPTVTEGARSVRFTAAAVASARSHSWVRLD